MPLESRRPPPIALRAAIGASVLFLLLVGVADGHGELVSSSPAANASLATAPATVRLEFSEPVDLPSLSVVLLDERQQPLGGVGTPRADGSGRVITASLPDLQPGVYTVNYRVTSATDGHVTSGLFAFLVDPTRTIPAPTQTASASSPSEGPATTVARWVALVGALLLAGTALFWLASGLPSLRSVGAGVPAQDVVWPSLAGAAAVTFVAMATYLTLAALPFTQPNAGSAASGARFPLDFAAPFGSTSFAWAMRLGLGASALALALAAGRHLLRRSVDRGGRAASPSDGRLLAAVFVFSILVLAANSLAGHAFAYGGPAFAAFDLLHLLGVAAWLGTLPGLLLLATTARHAAPRTSRRAIVVAALRRHSTIALVAAPIVALTGIANSPIVLGSTRQLVGSGYGDLLLAKALLFSVAVGIGAANFFLVRQRRGVPVLSLAACELAIGAVAVLAAATMVTVQPAVSRVPILSASSVATAHLYGQAGPSTIHVAVDVPSPGTQQYQLSVADAVTGAYRANVQKVFLIFTPPSGSDLPARRVELRPQGPPGLWGATGAYTPLLGEWKLGVLVRRAGPVDDRTTFQLPVVRALPPQRVPPPDTGVRVPAPLALIWVLLPEGPVAWLIPGLLLALVIAAFTFRSMAPGGIHALGRLAALTLAIVIGLAVGTRTIVEAANRPTQKAANPIPASDESIANGRLLYLANCSSCHGVNGSGDGPAAAGMLPAPGQVGTTVRASTDDALSYQIANGIAGTDMPSFATTLSENDRWDLVNYLRATWPPDR